jgi:hypothetical protein
VQDREHIYSPGNQHNPIWGNSMVEQTSPLWDTLVVRDLGLSISGIHTLPCVVKDQQYEGPQLC